MPSISVDFVHIIGQLNTVIDGNSVANGFSTTGFDTRLAGMRTINFSTAHVEPNNGAFSTRVWGMSMGCSFDNTTTAGVGLRRIQHKVQDFATQVEQKGVL